MHAEAVAIVSHLLQSLVLEPSRSHTHVLLGLLDNALLLKGGVFGLFWLSPLALYKLWTRDSDTGRGGEGRGSWHLRPFCGYLSIIECTSMSNDDLVSTTTP